MGILIFFFIICLVFLYLWLFLGEVRGLARSKLRSFECGFNRVKSARVSFSLRFFLVILIFLVFDIEFFLLVPLSVGGIYYLENFFYFFFTLFVIVLGLFYECIFGILN